MKKPITILKRNTKIYTLLVLVSLSPYNSCFSQEISKTLDSIHLLKIPNVKKEILYQRLLNLHEKNQNYTQLGHDAHQIAKWIVRDLTKRDLAIRFLKKGIMARKKAIPFDPVLLQKSYNNLGLYYLLNQKFKKSIDAYKKVINISSGSDRLKGKAYSKIGLCYSSLEDPYTSIYYFKKAFKLLENNETNIIKNHIDISGAYNEIRTVESGQIAIEHLLKADSLLKNSKKNNLKREYQINNDIAAIYFDLLNNIPEAESYYSKALELSNKIKNKTYKALTLYNLAFINIQKNSKKSFNYFHQSLKLQNNNHQLSSSIYYGLAKLENNDQNYSKSTQYFIKSLYHTLNKNTGKVNFQWNISEEQFSHIENKSFLLEVLRGHIDNYLQHSKVSKNKELNQKAIKVIKLADKLIDQILQSNRSYKSKLLFRTLISSVYTLGIESCIATNQLDYAFYLLEKNKSIMLLKDIAQNDTLISSDLLKASKRIEREVIYYQDVYKRANTSKDSLLDIVLSKKDELEKYKDTLKTKYPNIKINAIQPKIRNLSDLQLKPDEVILHYMMTERIGQRYLDTYCMLITPDNQQLFTLENAKTLQNKIQEYRKLLAKPFVNTKDIEVYRQKSNEVYRAIIPEAIKPLLKNKKVKIVPDHWLSTIPFEALVMDTNTGKYLIEDAEISYTYSLSFDAQNKLIPRNAPHSFLGMAPVDFTEDLASLKSSTKELKKAESLYPGTLYLNEQATKEHFIDAIDQHQIIHLATHANAADSIAPWIAFRHKKLIASELGLLQHQAELVVLSACNTSLGEVRSGEGVQSLARGFFQSGAKSVIPSLWSTNDKATATITQSFYKELSTGKTKARALRNAKLAYIQNNSDAEASPHYWASLILLGDTGTLVPPPNTFYLWYVFIGLCIAGLLLLWSRKYLKKKSN